MTDRQPLRDVFTANTEWGANCGPGALAAALGHPSVNGVRMAVSTDGKFKGYMGINDMRAAVKRARGRMVKQWSSPEKSLIAKLEGPAVMLINWGGPWDRDPRAAAAHRHWVAYRPDPVELTNRETGEQIEVKPAKGWVFDVNNCGDPVIWTPLAWWREFVLTGLMLEAGGDGTNSLGWVAQVERDD